MPRKLLVETKFIDSDVTVSDLFGAMEVPPNTKPPTVCLSVLYALRDTRIPAEDKTQDKKDRIKAQKRASYMRNKEKQSEYYKTYYQEHRDNILMHHKQLRDTRRPEKTQSIAGHPQTRRAIKTREELKEYNKQYYEKNKQKLKEKRTPITDEQREKRNQYYREYYQNNKQKIMEKRNTEEQRAKQSEYYKDYYQKNKEKYYRT